MGNIKIVDLPEVEQKISRELKERNPAMLLGFNDEYCILYRKDFNTLVRKDTQSII